MVPLAMTLKEDNLMSQATKYVSYILEHQSSDGWLGPDDIRSGDMYWGPMNVLNAFRMYSEGIEATDPSMSDNLKTAMLKYILEAQSRMSTTPLSDWAASRYMDFILSVHWLLEKGGEIINGYEQNLWDVASLAHSQGNDWEYWFQRLPTQPVAPDNTSQYTHGVNNAQAFKSAAVWYRQTGNDSLETLSRERLTKRKGLGRIQQIIVDCGGLREIEV